jgi:hypothetical protein
LHRFGGGHLHHVLIDQEEGKVRNQAGLTSVLGDYTRGAEAEACKLLHLGVGEDNPLRLFNKICKLVLEELMLIIAALVGSPADGLGELGGGSFGECQ